MHFSAESVDLSTLRKRNDHTYDELMILSIEGGLYQPFVSISGHYHPVCDELGRVLLTRSAAAAKKPFEAMAFSGINLLHRSCYDEMIGQPSGGDNTALLRQANPITPPGSA